jgi:hypothetical protein
LLLSNILNVVIRFLIFILYFLIFILILIKRKLKLNFLVIFIVLLFYLLALVLEIFIFFTFFFLSHDYRFCFNCFVWWIFWLLFRWRGMLFITYFVFPFLFKYFLIMNYYIFFLNFSEKKINFSFYNEFCLWGLMIIKLRWFNGWILLLILWIMAFV